MAMRRVAIKTRVSILSRVPYERDTLAQNAGDGLSRFIFTVLIGL